MKKAIGIFICLNMILTTHFAFAGSKGVAILLRGFISARVGQIFLNTPSGQNLMSKMGITLSANTSWEQRKEAFLTALESHSQLQEDLTLFLEKTSKKPPEIQELSIEQGFNISVSTDGKIKVKTNPLEALFHWPKKLILRKGSFDFRGMDFREANFTEVGFERVSLQDVDFRKANLRRASFFSMVNLQNTDFRGADLTKAYFSFSSDLRGVKFEEVILSEALLNGANLQEVNFTGANLVEAELIRADLRRAVVADANLTMAKLQGADLRGVDLTTVRSLNKAEYDSSTKFDEGFDPEAMGMIEVEVPAYMLKMLWEKTYNRF